MSDSFTETTRTSWFARLRNALSGIVIGLLLVLLAVVGLFWNEGRSVKTARALTEGAGIVQSIDAAAPPATAQNQLVHITGALVPEGRPSDPVFGAVTAPEGTLALVRSVEMYQWKEESSSQTTTKLGGGEETTTTYSYKRVWSSSEIDSGAFKQPQGHANPSMPVSTESFAVESATIGAVRLSGDDLSGIGSTTTMVPDQAIVSAVRQAVGSGKTVAQEGERIAVRQRVNADTVGDLRISFSSRDADRASAVGKLDGSSLSAYTASNGRDILLVEAGDVPAQAMFESAQSTNSVITWLVRIAGFVAMLIGFNMVLSVLGVAGDVIPGLGGLIRFATGLVAFAVTAAAASLVIGFAWLFYRPVLALSIIAVGVILFVAALRLARSRAKAQAPATGAAPAA